MTIDVIVKEIEKRIEELNTKYNEYYWQMIACCTADDIEGEDEAIKERTKISYELGKLRSMLAESKR